mgnify:CR=1 FL=1
MAAEVQSALVAAFDHLGMQDFPASLQVGGKLDCRDSDGTWVVAEVCTGT